MILKNKKIFFMSSLVLVGALSSTLFLVVKQRSQSTVPTQTIKQPGGDITVSPPTKQEQAESNAAKDQIVKDKAANSARDNNPSASNVIPVITFVDQNGINAYVSGVYETGGTCTATLSQGSAEFKKSVSSFKDATTTSCSPIDFSATDFTSKGTWTARVAYSSSTSNGSSQPINFTVK